MLAAVFISANKMTGIFYRSFPSSCHWWQTAGFFFAALPEFTTVTQTLSVKSVFTTLPPHFFFLNKYLCYQNVLYSGAMRDLFLWGSSFYCFILPESAAYDFLRGSRFFPPNWFHAADINKTWILWKTHTYCRVSKTQSFFCAVASLFLFGMLVLFNLISALANKTLFLLHTACTQWCVITLSGKTNLHFYL